MKVVVQPLPKDFDPPENGRSSVDSGSAGFERRAHIKAFAGLSKARVLLEARGHDREDLTPWATGFDPVDECLPGRSLNRFGLHEIEPLRPTHMPSLTGFAFGLLSRLRSSQPIIWCVTSAQVGEYGQLYAHGLQRYGISPSQIIFSKVHRPVHLHFALEEAIKTDGVAAVIGEGPRPTFTGSRRLSVLTREYGRPCLLLGDGAKAAGGSAALTRWQIAPCQGAEDPHDPFGPGIPTWWVSLPRVRGGRASLSMEPSSPPAITTNQKHNINQSPWRIVWDDQTLRFHSASLFRHGTVPTRHPAFRGPSKTMVG
ncbi:MAG: hypothetical protein AAGF28_07810 [Pseudomonadota bacterium]